MPITVSHMPNLADYGMALAAAAQAIEKQKLEQEMREFMLRVQAQRAASRGGGGGGGGGAGHYIGTGGDKSIFAPFKLSRSGPLPERRSTWIPPGEAEKAIAAHRGEKPSPTTYAQTAIASAMGKSYMPSGANIGQMISNQTRVPAVNSLFGSTVGGYLSSLLGRG